MRWLRNIKNAWAMVRLVKVKPILFVIPVMLSLLSAGLDGLSLSLLIPLLKGVVEFDFSFVNEISVLKDVIVWLPALSASNNLSVFAWLVVIIFSAALLKNVTKYWAAVSGGYIGRVATDNLRRLVFRRYLKFGKLFFDSHSLGYLNQVLMRYTEQVVKPINQGHVLLNTIFSLMVYLLIMFTISWKITLLVVVLVPVMNYALRLVIARVRRTSKILANTVNRFSKQVYNILSSVPLVKAYTNEEGESLRFARLSNRVASLEFNMNKSKQLIAPVQESITLVAVLLVVVSMAWVTISGNGEATASFLVFFYVVMNAASTYGGINRWWGVLAEVAGPLEEVKKMLSDRGKFMITDGTREFIGLKRKIECRELSFSFPNARVVLDGVSFEIERGKMTAIVGPTGAGKSTIINLLMRMYESSPGQILFDGIDIREFKLQSLRAQVALVSQDTQLFNDSLRNNITYALGFVSDERVAKAVEAARLNEFVDTLPDGLETAIGDKGVKLSGGEKQRVAIARALLKGVDILILDEATSALDSRTEYLIQGAIDEAVQGRTAIVIAHRLSTIKHADKIVVLDDGKMVEWGTLTELINKRGLFYAQWQAQKFF